MFISCLPYISSFHVFLSRLPLISSFNLYLTPLSFICSFHVFLISHLPISSSFRLIFPFPFSTYSSHLIRSPDLLPVLSSISPSSPVTHFNSRHSSRPPIEFGETLHSDPVQSRGGETAS